MAPLDQSHDDRPVALEHEADPAQADDERVGNVNMMPTYLGVIVAFALFTLGMAYAMVPPIPKAAPDPQSVPIPSDSANSSMNDRIQPPAQPGSNIQTE